MIRRLKHPTEARQLDRLQQIAFLTDDDLREIVGDWHAGISREIADNELIHRTQLTAHERIKLARGRE